MLTPIRSFLKQMYNFKLLSIDYGQWRSIRDANSVDSHGRPIPWYTYPATEFLSHLDWTQFKVFEYGSGNSTLWWSKRAKHITSVENDEAWYKKIKDSLKTKNAIYHLEKKQSKYISMASNDFDIFIVDGSYRRECIKHLVNLKKGRTALALMIILDNADWYPKSVRFLQKKLGWLQIDFHGFAPINRYTMSTSIFLNPARYSELKYFKALKSKCAVVQINNKDD